MMKTKLSLFALLWLLSISVLSAEEGTKPYALVTVSVANMRCQPEYAAEMATQCLLGSPVRILGKNNNGWYHILTPDEYDCWVHGSSLKLQSRDDFNQWIESPKIIYLQDNGFVFSKPEQDAPRVSDLVSGCVLRNKGTSGEDFLAVQFPDGRHGYVLKKNCRDFEDWKKNIQLSGDSLVEKARDFMGVPYLWGGTSSKMLDCSGMTKLCFFLNGVIIPRNASAQAKVGEQIEFSEIQKGDLLFFGTQKRVSHVGLSMGDGLVIHEAGRVHIGSLKPESELYDESLAKRLIIIRRLTIKPGDKKIIPISDHPLYRLQGEEGVENSAGEK